MMMMMIKKREHVATLVQDLGPIQSLKEQHQKKQKCYQLCSSGKVVEKMYI